MNRRELGHLLAVILVAAALRWLLFPWVGVWGDYGFYIYDSRLILEGGVPFVDFLGRSPLFNYSFAAVRALFDNPIPLLRVWISTLWLATVVPVYAIANHIEDHRTGIAAAGLFAWLPFGLVYGMWANTQSLAALLAVTGIYVILRTERLRWLAVAGLLFGLAYLSRRSVIVVAGAAGLYLIWQYRNHHDRRRVFAGSAALTVGFALALVAVYGTMVGFNLRQTWALFEVHTLNLFFSYGRGGYPLITADAPIVTNNVSSGRVPILNDLCQTCGAWTARTFAKTLLVTVPAAGLAFPYFRDVTAEHFDRNHKEMLGGALLVLAGYAAVRAVLAGFWVRALIVLSLVGFAVLAYRIDRLDRGRLYDRDLQLVIFVLLALAAGYLYRNRILHTYYFMDFWPYLSIVCGVTLVGLWDRAQQPLRVALAVVLIVAALTSVAGAHPLTNVAFDDNDDGWFTMDNIHDIRDDINQRTDPGDTVLTTSPAFLADTHAQTLNDNPRLHMVLVRYKNSGPGKPLYADMAEAMRTGEAKYLIFSRTMRNVLRWNDTVRQLFYENYCRVAEADDLYQRASGFLYRYQPNDCSCAHQPVMHQNLSDADDEGGGYDQVRRHESPLYSPVQDGRECPP